MTTPNISIDGLPTIRSFASVSNGSTVVFEGHGPYFELDIGVSTVTVTVRNGSGKAHLSTDKSYKARYQSVDIPEGRPVVLTNISRAPGTTRYLNITADSDATDVGITVITYPL